MKRSISRLGVGVAVVSLGAWLAGSALAAPASSNLQAQLMALFDHWQRAIGDGKLADAAAISVSELAKQIDDAAKSEEEAASLAAMARSMTPDKLDLEHASVSKDGKHAVIIALATVKVPENIKLPPDAPADAPKPGQIIHNEITLKFERAGNEWKFAERDFGGDPADIKHCHDESREVLTSYDQGRSQNAGGPISRVELRADHTLVVFRIVDEENCVILPNKEQLAKRGFDAASLTPYAIIEIDGYPHKVDKQRVWADKFRILQDE
jgi:hypothetical protein